MKAVYAVLSLMLAASLAWAGSGRELQICDRCEVERVDYQAPNPGNECSPDGIRTDFESERDQPDYPSEPDILRPQQHTGGVPDREESCVLYNSELEAPYIGGSPDREESCVLPNSELEAPMGRNTDFCAHERQSVPLPARENPGIWPPPIEAVSLTGQNDHSRLPPIEAVSLTGQNDHSRLPPIEAVSLTGQNDHSRLPPIEAVSLTGQNDRFFWPPPDRVLPPLEFDGSNDPSHEFAKETPPVESDGGETDFAAEQPPAIAW